jgi:N-acyl-D-amino-acid deacylase
MALDLLVLGGTVFDGTGAPGRRADIGVQGERIVAVSDLQHAEAALRVDVAGLAVAPGFIDMHTHSDFTLLVDGRADSAVCQGVTTEVVGQCGFSAAPLGALPDASQMLGHVADAGVALDWRRFADYLDRLDAARPAVNVAAFVGHGALRRVAGADIAALDALAEQAFDEGAWGLSTGLEYWPGNEAPAAEIDAMAAVAARRGRLYATHVRNRDVDCELGFAEAIRSARTGGARLQISHIQPKFGAPAGAMARALEMLDAAAREGVDAAFDLIPHEWSHTVVVASLPAWARDGGTQATLARLQDRTQRERMKQDPRPIWRLVSARQWHRIVLLHSREHPELVGIDFATIGRLRQCDAHDAMFDLLLAEGEAMPQMLWTSRNFEDADICMGLRDARCSVMSDSMTVCRHGPLAGTIGSLGGYGWAARVLGEYSRDRGVLSLAEAVHRLSGRPAQRLGMTDRGVVREGAFADLVVFDPAHVRDLATPAEPAQHPTGFLHVWVNGQAVVQDGRRTEARPGRVLRA